MDNLSPTEAATLALSSKAILNTIGRQVLRIEDPEDRIGLLKHLEMFYPKHVLCYRCGKFHLCRRRALKLDNETPCDKENGYFTIFPIGIFDHKHTIPFTMFQGVMNRHRYGRKHGLNKSLLRRCDYYRYYPLRKSLRAEIVDDRLILEWNIATYHETRCCFHIDSSTLKSRYYKEDRPKVRMNNITISCALCPTQICFNIRYERRHGKAFFRATVRYNLGDCRSSYELEWRRFTDRSAD